jgi:ferredoxin-type protein NapG
MQFRYKLAKETFKGKKPPKKKAPGEDNISADQRGDHTWSDSQLLSMDKTTKRVEPKLQETKEAKEVSRRELFSFGRISDFAEAVEEGEKNLPKANNADTEASPPVDGETEPQEIAAPVPEPQAKKGFFRRMVSKIRPGAKKEESEDPPDDAVAETNTADEPQADAVAPPPYQETIMGIPVDEEEVDPEFSRRNLLKQGVHFFAKPAMETVQNKIDRVNETVDKITKRVPLIRPPGAISERQFLQACTRCDKCIHACPKDAIQKVPKKMGFLIAGSPYIDPMKIPCVMCDDLPCISACPDGALVPPPYNDRLEVKMGYAIMDKNKCQAHGDTFCQQCVIDCPIPGAITQKDEKPVFHKNTCTGCGVCVLSCSTVNIPVAIKIKPQMVIESQLQKKRLEIEKARIQAEREAAEKQAQLEAAEEIEGAEDPINN